MRPYCEEAMEIVPTIRALIAKEMLEKYKLTQSEVGEKLGVSQAAVSQYKRDLRGFRVKKLNKNPEIRKKIEDLTADIITGKLKGKKVTDSFCLICELASSIDEI